MMEPDSEISLKILIDKDNNKVLYAECGKDFVDFLLSLLSMRMGTMIHLLEKQSMVGCIDKLYESVENLSGLYMLLPRKNRKALLDPCFVPRFRMKRLRLLPVLAQKRRKRKITPQERLRNRFLIAQAKSRENTLYTCSKCRQYVCCKSLFVCPRCDHSFDDRVRVIKPDSPSDLENVTGVVKALVTYMISDDLIVKPLSTLSCLTIAKKSNIKDITILEEKTCTIGFDEARKLMKVAFQSKSVLTDVFLGASVI